MENATRHDNHAADKLYQYKLAKYFNRFEKPTETIQSKEEKKKRWNSKVQEWLSKLTLWLKCEIQLSPKVPPFYDLVCFCDLIFVMRIERFRKMSGDANKSKWTAIKMNRWQLNTKCLSKYETIFLRYIQATFDHPMAN